MLCINKIVKSENKGFKGIKGDYFRITRNILRAKINNGEVEKYTDRWDT